MECSDRKGGLLELAEGDGGRRRWPLGICRVSDTGRGGVVPERQVDNPGLRGDLRFGERSSTSSLPLRL